MTTGSPMAGLPRFAAGLALTLFLIAVAGAQSAPAQTIPDPAALDVSGVKLGMTPDQALASLKAFDASFTITKRYLTGPATSFGVDGFPLDQIAPSERDTSYLDSLYASKGAAVQQCNKAVSGTGMPWCVEKHPDDQETIKVWFSRVPDHERVIAVQREKTFYKEPKPATATLKDGILAKYGTDQVTFDTRSGWVDTIGWLFDARRRSISNAAAKAKRMDLAGGLPRMVRPGDGISLSAVLTGNNVNSQIAEQLLVTLADGDALYKSIDEGKTTYNALKAHADAVQVDKASKSQSQTKF